MLAIILHPLLLLCGAYLLYKFIILPLFRMRFYKKQGLMTSFSPFVGSYLLDLLTLPKKRGDALYDIKQLAKEKPDTKAIVKNFAATPVLILLDPAIKKSFAFQHHLYEVPPVFGDFAKVFSSGIIGAKGDEWKKQRKIISQSFHFDFIREHVSTLVSTTRELIQDLAQRKDLKKIPVIGEFKKIGGEDIARVFFSENLKQYSIKGLPVTTHLMNTIVNLGKSMMSLGYVLFGPNYIGKGIWPSHRELISDIKALEDVCQKILEDRRKSNKQTKDLAYYLLESQKNPAEEDRLSDETIISNYVTFIAAGSGNTAHLVGMTIYALAKNPEMLNKLKKEIEEIYNKESPLTTDALNKMNWLSAVLKETLRVYNSAAIGPAFREAVADHKIGDIDVKKGTLVGPAAIFTMSQSEYFENPEEYRPERWLEKANVSEPYAYTPFWAGPRNCIGQHLALIQAKIMICEFVKKFEFELVKDYKLRMDMRDVYGPADELPMNLTVREKEL